MSGEVGDTRGRYLSPEERARMANDLHWATYHLTAVLDGYRSGRAAPERAQEALEAVRRSLELLRGPTPAERPPGSARPS